MRVSERDREKVDGKKEGEGERERDRERGSIRES